MSSAAKELEKLPKNIQRQIDGKITGLGVDPKPSGTKKLKTKMPQWRIRIGDYRIVYTVDDEKQVVIVNVVGHRSHVYRGV